MKETVLTYNQTQKVKFQNLTAFFEFFSFNAVFLNNLKEKKEEIIIFGNKVIPVSLDVREENGVYIINGKQSYYKLSSSKLKEIFEKEYQRSFNEIIVYSNKTSEELLHRLSSDFDFFKNLFD